MVLFPAKPAQGAGIDQSGARFVTVVSAAAVPGGTEVQQYDASVSL